MQQLMLAVEQSVAALGGRPVQWRSTGGVCDGNKLAAAGLPNIDTLGPVGDGLHSAREWVQPASLVEKAKLVVNLLSRFSQGEFAELERTSKSNVLGLDS
jgi:glutamate carboxypeptidase